MKRTIRPLTPDLWPALEDLFGENGAVGGLLVHVLADRQSYSREPARGEQGSV
jgi:hypothetical protein